MKRRAFLSSVATSSIALSVPVLEGHQANAATQGSGAGALSAGGGRELRPSSKPPCRFNLDGSISRIGQWSLDELHRNLREVIELLLEDGDPKLSAEFVGVHTVQVA